MNSIVSSGEAALLSWEELVAIYEVFGGGEGRGGEE